MSLSKLSLPLSASRVASGSSWFAANPASRKFASSSVHCALRSMAAASTAHSNQPSVTLYQYAICPFCNKAKALIAYCGIDPKVVEVNPLTKAELKPWSGDYKKVPIAILDDEQLNGSDAIVSTLLEHPYVDASLNRRWKSMNMDEFQNSESAQKWTDFANNELAVLLYPNICRTLGDSFQAFGYVKNVDSFSPFQKASIRSVGSLAMYFAASKIKSKRGISDEREALNTVLTTWEEEGIPEGNLFASGTDEPNMGDIAMFGTLRSIEGLPAHAEVVSKRCDAMQAWYDRMSKQVHK